MKNLIKYLLIGLVFLTPFKNHAASAEFLLFPSGARQNGLGTAFVGMADDAGALFYNPAGLGIIDRYQVMINEAPRNLGEHFNSLSLAYPMGKHGIGVHTTLLHFGFGQDYKFWSEGEQINDFSLYSLSVGAGYGRIIMPDLSVGGSVKYIRDVIHTYSADTFAMDVGILYQMQLMSKSKFVEEDVKLSRFNKNFRAGFSIQNIGGKIRFIESGEGDSLPIKMNLGCYYVPISQIGISYQFSSVLNDSFEIIESTTTSSFGIEFLRTYFVIPRLGYSALMTDFGQGDIFAGLGVKLDYFGLFYQLDYTYKLNRMNEDLQQNHIASITLGKSAAMMRWVTLSGFNYYDQWYNIMDGYIKQAGKKLINEKQQKEITKIDVYLNKFQPKDEVSEKYGFERSLFEILTSKLADNDYLQIAKNKAGADTTLDCDINIEGELVTTKVAHALPETDIKFNDSFSGDYIEEEAAGEVEAIVFMNQKGETLVLKETSKQEQQNLQNLEFEKIADNIIKWLEKTGVDMNSCHVTINAKKRGLKIYVDNFIQDTTDKDGYAAFKVSPGRHTILVKESKDMEEEQDINAEKGGKLKLNFNLEESTFYSDLSIQSYPSKAEVEIDGEKEGHTPFKKKRLKNGIYKVKITYKGEIFEDEINITKRGYNILKNYVFQYNIATDRNLSKFWTPLQFDPGIQAKVQGNTLSLSGRMQDDSVKGSGFVSKEFSSKNMEIGFQFKKVNLKSGILMAGLYDSNNNAVLFNYDGKYFAVRKIVNNDEKLFVKAVESGENQILNINIKYYKELQEAEVIVNERLIGKVNIEFAPYIRVIIISDGKDEDQELSFITDKFWIK